MPSGMELYTPDGRRQIVYGLVYFRLEGKYALDQGGWNTGGPVNLFGLATGQTVFVPGVSTANAPVAAISCATPTFAVIQDTSGGINVTVYRLNTGAAPATLYVFSNRRPPDPGKGWVLYDGGGPLVSLLTPLLRPLGRYDNAGYNGVSLAGRSCAHIPQRRGRRIERQFTTGGLGSCTYSGTSGQPTQGYQISYKDVETTWFVSCEGSNVSWGVASYTPTSSIPYLCQSSPSGTSNTAWTQNQYSSLIIDVSGY